jgi:uncharacterized protein involved in type VI secretion and phage assembly
MSATSESVSELLLGEQRNLRLEVSADGVALSVRSFHVREAVSELFEVSVVAVSPQADLELGAIVGRPASLRIMTGELGRAGGTGRTWSGICCHIEQLRAEPDGLSTYACRIAPRLWLLGLRRDHRIFQHLSVPEILERVLAPWQVTPVWALDRSAFPKLHYKVQYGESDLAFLFRLSEEAGLAITFTDDDDGRQAGLPRRTRHGRAARGAADPRRRAHRGLGLRRGASVERAHRPPGPPRRIGIARRRSAPPAGFGARLGARRA